MIIPGLPAAAGRRNKFGSRLAAIPWLIAAVAPCAAGEPFADIHVHFNWDQKEIISADEIVARLRRANVAFAVVTSTPSALALELKQAGGDLIVPFFSPYTHELGRRDWYLDSATVRLAEQGLRQGLYRGIGEMHFMAGFRPATDNPVFTQLMRLARRFDVPALVHVDAASEIPFVRVCEAHPQVKIIFAHAGGNLRADHVRRVIERCANVTVEFSARDPWRYGGLTDDDVRLLPAWRDLVVAFPDRFVTGTDPVWKVTRTQTWDQADDGWDYFAQLLDYHRRWLGDLPKPVRDRIRLENARRLLACERNNC